MIDRIKDSYQYFSNCPACVRDNTTCENCWAGYRDESERLRRIRELESELAILKGLACRWDSARLLR
jgi:hypothetical protein